MLCVGLLKNLFKHKDYNPATGWSGSNVSAWTSPWLQQPTPVRAIIVPDAVLPEGDATIAQALGIPPIARAVMAYSSVISEQPLMASVNPPFTGDVEAATQWLNHSQGWLTPAMRNVKMFQDIFWAGHCVLRVGRDSAGYVNDAEWLPLDRWSLDADGNVLLDGYLEDQASFVYIGGFLPMGFLQFASATIRHYWAMINTIESRSNNPVPLVAIYIDEDCDLSDDEIDDVVEDWSNARRAKNGAVAVVPKGVRVEVLGDKIDSSQLLTAGRNAARLDVANFVNMPGALVDGNNGTSGTYENTLQNQSEFAALSLPLFTKAIAGRLSQDDVTPPGVTVSFDSSKFDQASTPAVGNTGSAVPAAPTIQGEIVK